MSLIDNLFAQVRETGAWRWYANRDSSERPIIAGVALLVLAAVIWLAIWKPISDWRAVEANRLQNAQATWQFIKTNEQAARARSRQAASGNTGQRSLLPVVTREANAKGIRLNRLQPESDGAVSVVLQAQPFNGMIEWLARLQTTHQVTVQRISVDAEGKPGLVNAQIRLL